MLPAADMTGLMAAADIVISLHRSEGFGLVPAQAMALGKPVIATGWSGNLDFMNKNNSALVSYSLMPVHDPEGAFEADDQMWADANVEEAAAWLRRLADDRRSARPPWRCRRRDVAAQLSPKHFAARSPRSSKRGAPLMSTARASPSTAVSSPRRSSGVQRFAAEADQGDRPPARQQTIAALKVASRSSRRAQARDFPLKNIPLRRVGYFTGYAWEQIEFPLHAARAAAAQSLHARTARRPPPDRGRA